MPFLQKQPKLRLQKLIAQFWKVGINLFAFQIVPVSNANRFKLPKNLWNFFCSFNSLGSCCCFMLYGRWWSLLFIFLHFCSYLFIFIHICSSLFILIHICSFLVIFGNSCSFLFIICRIWLSSHEAWDFCWYKKQETRNKGNVGF